MVTYPGDPPVVLERVSSIPDGDGYNLSRLDFGLHAGTHVDAPLHFIEGAAGVEALPFDVLIGPAYVVDATAVKERLSADALGGLALPERGERSSSRSGTRSSGPAMYSPRTLSLSRRTGHGR